MNSREFASVASRLKNDGVDVSLVIRTALTNVLGDIPAEVILSYTGDASNGDVQAFGQRMEELLGNGAQTMFANITSWAKKNARQPVPRPERKS
jgi:hypothetical protein